MWRENMHGYLSADILPVPRSEQFSESVARGTDKCPRANMRTFCHAKWRPFAFNFHNTGVFENWRISSPSFSWEIFGHVTCLDQSDICPWTLSVPQSSEFSSSYALGKQFAYRNGLCPRTNI